MRDYFDAEIEGCADCGLLMYRGLSGIHDSWGLIRHRQKRLHDGCDKKLQQQTDGSKTAALGFHRPNRRQLLVSNKRAAAGPSLVMGARRLQ